MKPSQSDDGREFSQPQVLTRGAAKQRTPVTLREFIGWKMGQKLPISLGQTEKGCSEWDLDKSTIE